MKPFVAPKAAYGVATALLILLHSLWPSMKWPSELLAQIQRETCVSLKSKQCFSTHAELKTTREYGFGYGQLTVTANMNVWQDVKKSDPVLKNWAWDDRFNAQFQLRALVDMDMQGYARMSFAQDEWNRYAFMYSCYNGGCGGVIKDREICKHTVGCNPNLWYGNVELYSFKSHTALAGYGQGFFYINRSYVWQIQCGDGDNYIPLMHDVIPHPPCKPFFLKQ